MVAIFSSGGGVLEGDHVCFVSANFLSTISCESRLTAT